MPQERTHLVQPTTMPIVRVCCSQERLGLRPNRLILTTAQLTQHGRESHTVPNIPAGQIKLQPLPRAYGQHVFLLTDLASKHLGVIRYQHQPTLIGRKCRTEPTDRAATAPALSRALVQAEGDYLHSTGLGLSQGFRQCARLLAP